MMLTAPARSNERRPRSGGAESGTRRIAATSTAMATGTGSRKTHRQPTSVSRPPTTSPREKPVAPVAV